MWVLPDTEGIEPGYEQRDVGDALAGGGLVPVASGQGHDGAVTIHQRDAVLLGRAPARRGTTVDRARRAARARLRRRAAPPTLDGAGHLDTGDAARLTDAGAPHAHRRAPTAPRSSSGRPPDRDGHRGSRPRRVQDDPVASTAGGRRHVTRCALAGGVGEAGAVTRRGRFVLRPANPHTPTIHRFLSALAEAGFDGASVPDGIEPDGRERLLLRPRRRPAGAVPGVGPVR